jgi:hypothetical protein
LYTGPLRTSRERHRGPSGALHLACEPCPSEAAARRDRRFILATLAFVPCRCRLRWSERPGTSSTSRRQAAAESGSVAEWPCRRAAEDDGRRVAVPLPPPSCRPAVG